MKIPPFERDFFWDSELVSESGLPGSLIEKADSEFGL
jgi:hypothetical protein